MSSYQRRKGKVGEREAAAELKAIGCLNAARRVRNSEGDSDLVDAVAGVSFECKLESVSRPAAAMRQAITQCREGELPAVLHRETAAKGQPRNDWLITLRISDVPRFLELYQQSAQPVPQAP